MNKFLSTTIAFLCTAFAAFAANPSYQAFKGVGGITVTTNPPQGDVTIDGSGISAGALPTYALTNNHTVDINLGADLRIAGTTTNVGQVYLLDVLNIRNGAANSLNSDGRINGNSLVSTNFFWSLGYITNAGGFTNGGVIHAFSGVVLAGVTASLPPYINAQGTLTNASGTPDGTKVMLDDGTLSNIGSNNLTANGINSSKILDGTIGSNDMAASSINSSLILDATIVTADLADASVSSNKLVASSVNSSKILDGTVTLTDIQVAAANSKLVGSGAAGVGAPYAELTLGTGLSMSGTTLNASAGGNGGTNFPPKILIGTNITVGVGVRQNVTIKTNGSFGVNFQGTPLNGETVMLTVSNSLSTAIGVTNYQGGTKTSFFDYTVASNVTEFIVAGLSQRTVTFEFSTNAIPAGTVRQELVANAGKEMQLVFGYPLISDTNSTSDTFTVSGARQTNYATGTLTIDLATDVFADITNLVASAYTITLSNPKPGMSGTMGYVGDGTARTLTLSCPALAALANGGMVWLSTNDTASATNILTGVSKSGLFCWSVRTRHLSGEAPKTNIFLWHKVQTP